MGKIHKVFFKYMKNLPESVRQNLLKKGFKETDFVEFRIEDDEE